MAKRLVVSLLVVVVLVVARPAWAPFHIMAIQELSFGTSNAPGAQYMQLRTLAAGQVFVGGQRMTTFNADGSAAANFGRYDMEIALTNGDEGVAILAGTQAAHDLYCVAMDQLVTGQLVFPDGRTCFGSFASKPVDCVAYGSFAGDNGIFGQPAVRPILGKALTRVDSTNNNATDFTLDDPAPKNNSGEMGQIDGTPGDPDGTGDIDVADLDHEVAVLFEAGKRCDLEDPERRGADANIDTRINAADVTATIMIALPASA